MFQGVEVTPRLRDTFPLSFGLDFSRVSVGEQPFSKNFQGDGRPYSTTCDTSQDSCIY